MNGGTKTENLLRGIATGSNIDQYRTCCNTNVQKLLVDIYDRIDSLQPGGGTDFIGTDGVTPGVHGLVPAPAVTDAGKYLRADGTWASGAGGSSDLQDPITASVNVGGISSGTTFAAGTPLESVLRALLTPTVYPTFTAPSVTLNYYTTTLIEVGTDIPAMTATETFNAGAITLQGSKQADRAGAATGYAIATAGANTDYNNSNTTGSFSVPALTRSTPGNITVTATVDHAAGPQPKDSSGANYSSPLPAGSVTTTKTYEFILPFYFGKSTTRTISDFTGFDKDLAKKGNKEHTYDTTVEYVVFAYDASYGNLANIKDQNGFDITDGWTTTTLNVGGNDYKVYVSPYATTDTGAKYYFNFN